MNTKHFLRVLTAMLACACICISSRAEVGVRDISGTFLLSGRGSVPTELTAGGTSQLPSLNGHDFGSVCDVNPISLHEWKLEAYAFVGGSIPPGVNWNINWIDSWSTGVLRVTIRSGATVVSTTDYPLIQTGSNSESRFWSLSDSVRDINLAGILPAGSYTAEFTTSFIFFTAVPPIYGGYSWSWFTPASSTASFAVAPQTCMCRGDFIPDGIVDGADLAVLLAQWGLTADTTPSDLNGDGTVDGNDLGSFLSLWGTICPATIGSVTPTHSGTQGGTEISIAGTGLGSTTSVRIGGQSCTNLNIVTPNLVRASTPPGTIGEYDIAVMTAGGVTVASTPFRYVQQQVTSISPNIGCAAGGTPIVITGQYLTDASAVTIGGVPCTAVVAVSATHVTAVTSGGPLGTMDVVVTCPKGAVTVTRGFSYIAPQITSVVPDRGSYLGGARFTISGNCMAGATSVTIGGVPSTEVVSVSSTQLTAVAPPGQVGAMDVVVTCQEGAPALAGGFTYAPVIVPSWATLVEAEPDPAVVNIPELREAIAATGLAWRVRDTGTQMEMMLIPPGAFQMGCVIPDNWGWGCGAEELPVHDVTLTRAFYMGRYEVTQAQWVSVMGSNPSYYQAANQYPGSNDRPVESVSWNDVQGYLDATGMRLPTEAEWEYSCRAGTSTPYHAMPGYPLGTADANLLGYIAVCTIPNQKFQQWPIAVGQRAPNTFGLYDTLGNVQEIASDWFGPYSALAEVDPIGPSSGTGGVIRGGYWTVLGPNMRSSSRTWGAREWSGALVGFRVARNP